MHNGRRRYLTHYTHKHLARHFGCTAEESVRHIGSAAEVSGHFGSIPLLPKCLAAEMSYCRSVCTPYVHIRYVRRFMPSCFYRSVASCTLITLVHVLNGFISLRQSWCVHALRGGGEIQSASLCDMQMQRSSLYCDLEPAMNVRSMNSWPYLFHNLP